MVMACCVEESLGSLRHFVLFLLGPAAELIRGTLGFQKHFPRNFTAAPSTQRSPRLFLPAEQPSLPGSNSAHCRKTFTFRVSLEHLKVPVLSEM